MVGITKISSGIINVSDMKRVEKIMQKYISFFCCNSIEEFCEIYDFDFSILMNNWGTSDEPAVDFNGDGTVNDFDFSILMSTWTG